MQIYFQDFFPLRLNRCLIQTFLTKFAKEFLTPDNILMVSSSNIQLPNLVSRKADKKANVL